MIDYRQTNRETLGMALTSAALWDIIAIQTTFDECDRMLNDLRHIGEGQGFWVDLHPTLQPLPRADNRSLMFFVVKQSAR